MMSNKGIFFMMFFVPEMHISCQHIYVVGSTEKTGALDWKAPEDYEQRMLKPELMTSTVTVFVAMKETKQTTTTEEVVRFNFGSENCFMVIITTTTTTATISDCKSGTSRCKQTYY